MAMPQSVQNVCIPVEKLWTASNDACYSGDSIYAVWKSFCRAWRIRMFHVKHRRCFNQPIQPECST